MRNRSVLALLLASSALVVALPLILPTADVRLHGNAQGVEILAKGRLLGGALLASIQELPTGSSLQIKLSGPAVTAEQEFTLRKLDSKSVQVSFAGDRAPASLGPSDAQRGSDASVLLRVRVVPEGEARVTVNESILDLEQPAVAVPLDTPIQLVAERQGYKTFRRKFILPSSEVKGRRDWPMEVQLEPEKFGYLTLRTTPNADLILVNGRNLGRGSPLENEKVAIGSYKFQLINKVLGMEKTVQVKVEEGMTQKVLEKLELSN